MKSVDQVEQHLLLDVSCYLVKQILPLRMILLVSFYFLIKDRDFGRNNMINTTK